MPLSELMLRYWYTAAGTQAQAYNCGWAQVGCGNISAAETQSRVWGTEP